MELNDLQFKRFDPELLEKTKTIWSDQLDVHKNEVYGPAIQQKLDWAEKKVNDETGTIHVYALLHQDTGEHACAIIELSHAMPNNDNAWLKMLSMTVQPDFDAAVGGASNSDLAIISAKIILESYYLIFDQHPSAKLKILGNNSMSIDFLNAVAATLQDIKIKAYTQGQWLVIEKVGQEFIDAFPNNS